VGGNLKLFGSRMCEVTDCRLTTGLPTDIMSLKASFIDFTEILILLFHTRCSSNNDDDDDN
jgi:hypothetical protein